MIVVLFFSTWFALLALSYWYVGRRVIRAARWTGRQRILAWSTVAILFALPQVAFLLLVSGGESATMDILSWPAYISLGFFSLALTGVFFRDVALLFARFIGRISTRTGVRPGSAQKREPVDLERRRMLVHSTNLGILGLAAGISSYGVYESHRRATIEHITVPLKNLPQEFDGFHIAQFSDLHVGPTIKRPFVEGIVRQVNDLGADLIAFTGDMVDGSVGWLKNDVAPLRDLTAPHGVFFVTGNHEYYSGVGPWVKESLRLGFDVLMNEHRVVQRGDAKLVVAGVTDYSAGDFAPDQPSDPLKAVMNSPGDVLRILLAHQPRSITAAEQAGINLQLSGHTHGGQFFPWNHLATLNQPYIKGLHKHGDIWVYVNRGTGYWGPPLRVGISPEVTMIRLTRA